MINLNERRKTHAGSPAPLNVVQVKENEIPDVDLSTVQMGDWLEGIGIVSDTASAGFLHRLGQCGYGIAKRDLCSLCGSEEEIVQHGQFDEFTGYSQVATLTCKNPDCERHVNIK